MDGAFFIGPEKVVAVLHHEPTLFRMPSPILLRIGTGAAINTL